MKQSPQVLCLSEFSLPVVLEVRACCPIFLLPPSSFLLFIPISFYFFTNFYFKLCVCVHVRTDSYEGQKRVLDLVELEF